jgi:hypothetical protein
VLPAPDTDDAEERRLLDEALVDADQLADVPD